MVARPGSFIRNLTGISRQYFYRLRFGLTAPTQRVMIWLTLALRRVLQREVLATELFDLGEPGRHL